MVHGFHMNWNNSISFDVWTSAISSSNKKELLIYKTDHNRHEKWIVYNNVEQKSSWIKRHEPVPTIAKENIYQMMMCSRFRGNEKESFIINFHQTTIQSDHMSTTAN